MIKRNVKFIAKDEEQFKEISLILRLEPTVGYMPFTGFIINNDGMCEIGYGKYFFEVYAKCEYEEMEADLFILENKNEGKHKTKDNDLKIPFYCLCWFMFGLSLGMVVMQ